MTINWKNTYKSRNALKANCLTYKNKYLTAMVQHIVMWKLNESDNGANKEALGLELKNRLLLLKNKIQEIVTLEVGINGAYPDRNHDVVLVITFKNFFDLERYVNHPEHVKFVEFVRQITHSRVAIDYEH